MPDDKVGRDPVLWFVKSGWQPHFIVRNTIKWAAPPKMLVLSRALAHDEKKKLLLGDALG